MAMNVGSATVKIKAVPDTDGLIQFARIVEKHFGALADDLEKLRDGERAAAPPEVAEA